MKIIGKDVLDELKKSHADVRSQVDSWFAEVEAVDWSTSSDIKQRYASASFLSGNRVVFNLKGNRYRLLVTVAYKTKIVLVKKAGTHEEYMKWGTS